MQTGISFCTENMAGLQIVRVKRKINEPCTESIFLSSKRRKGADDEKDEQLVKETFLFLRTSNKEVSVIYQR